MLFGPVIAPIVGGALSQAFGWRSTFVLLAILTIPVFLITVFSVPETHHWLVMKHHEQKNAQQQQIPRPEQEQASQPYAALPSDNIADIEMNVPHHPSPPLFLQFPQPR